MVINEVERGFKKILYSLGFQYSLKYLSIFLKYKDKILNSENQSGQNKKRSRRLDNSNVDECVQAIV